MKIRKKKRNEGKLSKFIYAVNNATPQKWFEWFMIAGLFLCFIGLLVVNLMDI